MCKLMISKTWLQKQYITKIFTKIKMKPENKKI